MCGLERQDAHLTSRDGFVNQVDLRADLQADEEWAKIEAILDWNRPVPKPRIGDRAFIDAVVYRAKV